MGIRRGIFDREMTSWTELTEILDRIRLGEGEDVIVWALEREGSFAVKSAFLSLTKPVTPVERKDSGGVLCGKPLSTSE